MPGTQEWVSKAEPCRWEIQSNEKIDSQQRGSALDGYQLTFKHKSTAIGGRPMEITRMPMLSRWHWSSDLKEGETETLDLSNSVAHFGSWPLYRRLWHPTLEAFYYSDSMFPVPLLLFFRSSSMWPLGTQHCLSTPTAPSPSGCTGLWSPMQSVSSSSFSTSTRGHTMNPSSRKRGRRPRMVFQQMVWTSQKSS